MRSGLEDGESLDVPAVGRDGVRLQPSLQFQVTVTSDLFQPLAFGAGVFEANAIVGAVLSNLKLFEPDPTLPALSVHVRLTNAEASSGPE